MSPPLRKHAAQRRKWQPIGFRSTSRLQGVLGERLPNLSSAGPAYFLNDFEPKLKGEIFSIGTSELIAELSVVALPEHCWVVGAPLEK